MSKPNLNPSEASDTYNRIMYGGIFQMTKEEREIETHAIAVREWAAAHPGEVWVLEEVGAWWWVTNHAGISPIKKSRSRNRLIKWLDKQGADWLFKSDYELLRNAKQKMAQNA